MPDEGTLPLPSSTGPSLTPGMPPDQQGPDKKQLLMQLLQKLGPLFAGGMQKSQQQQPQGPQVTPARVPPMQTRQTPSDDFHGRYDPMSSVGFLPPPFEQPAKQGFQPSNMSAELMAKLDPQSASIFSGVQGITKFLQDSFAKKDQEQHSEAKNAAQALMAALEGAKATGDYRPAEHILENNESLFNKVYKGWLQKSEEAKKPQKKAKAPDPDVQGFEQGLQSYMQKGGQPPQPPSTLQGKSGAKYLMPQASPQQAVGQNQVSQQLQAAKQGQEVISPEERMKLHEGNIKIQEAEVGLQKAFVELQKAKTEAEKAGTNFAEQKTLYETRLASESEKHLKALIDKDITIGELRDKLIMKQNGGRKPPQITDAEARKANAAEQVSAYLEDMIAKAKPFKANDISALQGMLATAGASATAKGLPKGIWATMWSKPEDVSTFKQSFDKYKDSLKAGIDREPTKGSSNKGAPSSKEPIVISPEDMK